MAFMGLFVIGLILFLLFILLVLSILFLILGIIKHKSGKKIHVLFYSLSGVFFLPIVAMFLFICLPKKESFETPNGTASVWDTTAEQYIEALTTQDLSTLNNLLYDYPQLIYYTDTNDLGILEYGMATCNIELLQLGLDYGASFDTPIIYDKLLSNGSYSFFFDFLGYYCDYEVVKGETTDEILETVKFMMENGANAELGDDMSCPTLLFYAAYWVDDDQIISLKDMELLTTIMEYGCPTDTQNVHGQTALEVFYYNGFFYTVEEDAMDLFLGTMPDLPYASIATE